MRRRLGLAALLVSVALSGCATFLRPFDRSPSGLSSWDQSLRDLLRAGRFDSALALSAPQHADAGDDLLRLEYEGILAHYAGFPERSRVALATADQVADDRYTRSLTRTLFSFFTGDRTRAYDPPAVDRLFLHYYAALDYLATADSEDAAVEARLLEQRLALSGMDQRQGDERRLAATLHDFAGGVFEAAGRPDEAAVSYRLARRAAGRGEGAAADSGAALEPGVASDSEAGFPTGSDTAGRLPVAAAGGGVVEPAGAAAGLPGDAGIVVLAVERGFVAHRVPRSITLLLWPGELDALRAAGSGDARDARQGEVVADLVARRGLGLVPVSDGPSGRRHGDGDPYLLRVAWPAYAGGRVPDARLRVLDSGSGGDPVPVVDDEEADISAAVRRQFDRDAPGILAQALVRAVAKRALVEAVKKTASKKDEQLGEALGLAANLATALLEQADTRGLDLLPAQVRVLRLRLPAGHHRLRLEVTEPGRIRPRTIDLGGIVVEAGGVVVVPVRVWSGETG